MAASQVYRRDIDGLRALAVLLVVAFHAFPGAVSGGFVGVDVFFVISGFLISGLLLDWLDAGKFSLVRFYARRVCRLFPALLTVLTFCLLFGWAALLPDEFKRLGWHARGGLMYLLNYVFSYETGYFDVDSALKPFLHLWSLAVEEQFYIVWPFVLLGAHRLKISLESLIVAIFIWSFVSCFTTPETGAREGFYFTQLRLWEFLAGALLVQVQRTDGFSANIKAFLENPYLSGALSLTGLIAIIGAGFAFTDQEPYPGWRAVIPVLGTVFVIAAGARSIPNAAFLSNRGAVYIGLISYPLYLWHWPLLSFTRIIYGEEALTASVRLALVGASFLLAVGTFHLIEKPIRFGSFSRKKAALVLLALSGFLWGIGYSAEEKILPSYSGLFGPPVLKSLGAEWPYPSEKGEVFTFGGQSLYRFDGAKGGVLLLGDCNMEQYLPRFLKLKAEAPDRVKTALFMGAEDCLPIPGLVSPNRRADCTNYMNSALYVADSKAIDKTIESVMISAHWVYYFYFSKGLYTIEGQDLASEEGRRLALASFKEMVRSLRRKGLRVVVVLNIPAGKEMSPRRLVERSIFSFKMKEGRGGLALAEMEKRYGSVLQGVRAAALAGGAEVIDPTAFLCAEGVCPALAEDGAPIYMDENHLHPDFVRDQLTYLDKIWGQ